MYLLSAGSRVTLTAEPSTPTHKRAMPEDPSHLTIPNNHTTNSSDIQSRVAVQTNDDLVRRIDSFLNEPCSPADPVRTATQSKVRESLSVIQRALSEYGIDSLTLSFNGGKDCLVLLLLYIYILSHTPHPAHRIPTCFVTPPHSFPEVDQFVTDCAERYGLDVVRIALPMRAAFEAYLAGHPGTKAVLVGTRRTDPHGENLTHFDVTDHGWPKFMRVHPVINWHYWEIWDVRNPSPPPQKDSAMALGLGWTYVDRSFCGLCRCHIVCCMIGGMIHIGWVRLTARFTSLGGTLDTHPNPLLKDGKGKGGFKPAYELQDETKERYGRDR